MCKYRKLGWETVLIWSGLTPWQDNPPILAWNLLAWVFKRMRLSRKQQETMRLNPRCAPNWPHPCCAWTPRIGEQLDLQADHGNTIDRFAIAAVKDSNVTGHVPMEYSRIFWYFIQKCHSNIVCKICRSRRLSEVSGKGRGSVWIHLHWTT